MPGFLTGFYRPQARHAAVLIVLALLAAACNPIATATPTPTLVAVISAVTATATLAPIKPPTSTPTDTEEPDEEPTVTTTAEAAATGALGPPEFICSLIHEDEAAALLGQAVTSIKNGIDQDTVAGETINYCTWVGQGQAIVLSEVDAQSPEALANIIAQEQAAAVAEDSTATTTLENHIGLGEEAYWNVSENAAGYTVVTGAHIFSLALGGNLGDAGGHKEALLKLALLVAGRL